MDKLGFFVTSENDEILALSRKLLGEIDLENDPSLRNFRAAEHILERLGTMGLRYHSDPNVPFYQDDRVQYAHQTLKLKTGDCDDLVVLYSSLLESVGIRTAFVEVRDPEKALAHLYLMFNTGLPHDQGHPVLVDAHQTAGACLGLGDEVVAGARNVQPSAGNETRRDVLPGARDLGKHLLRPYRSREKSVEVETREAPGRGRVLSQSRQLDQTKQCRQQMNTNKSTDGTVGHREVSE